MDIVKHLSSKVSWLNYLLASGSLFLAAQGLVKIDSLTAITELNILL